MSDNPFQVKPEDVLNRALKVAVSALPVVGAPLGEFIQYVVGDPAQERRDEFMQKLAADLQDLSAKCEGAAPDRLRENVQFQATFIQAAQTAAKVVQEEKKTMLRNAVLNTVIGTIDENIRQIFMQLIEQLTPLHVALLSFLNDPAANPEAKERARGIMAGPLTELVRAALPAAAQNMDFTDKLAEDLNAAKLTNGSSLHAMVSGSGLLESRTTKLGKSFLHFISDPD
jgi:hypothetical protein